MGRYTQAVQQLYVAYFNRPADSGGLAYWEGVIASQSGSVAAISAAFSQSAEYIAAYAGMNNAQIVDQVYHNLFGRQAESGGLAYWVPLLDRRAITIDNVVTQVAAGAQGSDAVAYSSKVAAATTFTAFLTDSSIYAGSAASQVAKSYISAITDNASMLAATTSGYLAATYTNLANAHNNIRTVNLTSGVDHINPSVSVPLGGNDIFNATPASLNQGDQIDGGAGKDTFNLLSENDVPWVLPPSIQVANVEIAEINAGNHVSLDASGWKGLTDLHVTNADGVVATMSPATSFALVDWLWDGSIAINGGANIQIHAMEAGPGPISVGALTSATGIVNITTETTSGSQAGNISVIGGASINVVQQHGDSPVKVKDAAVSIIGDAHTASVSVLNEYDAVDLRNRVTISDASVGMNQTGSIRDVRAGGYASLEVNSNALSRLTLANASGDAVINGGGAIPDLTLTLFNIEGGNINLGVGATNLNLVLQGGYEERPTTISNATVTTMNLSGHGSLNTNLTGMTNLHAITVKGDATINLEMTQLALTSLDLSGATRGGTFSIDGNHLNFKGSQSSDIVTLTGNTVSKSVSLGAGSDVLNFNTAILAQGAVLDGGDGNDTLVMPMYLAALINTEPFANSVKNFEALEFLGSVSGAQTLDFSGVDNFDYLIFGAADRLTITNWHSERTLQLSAQVPSVSVQSPEYASGKADVLNLLFKSVNATDVFDFSTKIDAPGVESIVVNLADLHLNGDHDTLTISGNSVASVWMGGYGNLNLRVDNLALSSIDAKSILGSFQYTAEALASRITITGCLGQGGNDINLTAAVHGVDYFGGFGGNRIIVAGGNNLLHFSGTVDQVTFTRSGNSLSEYTAIDGLPSRSLALHFVGDGQESYSKTPVTLSPNASFRNYVDAAIQKGGDASTHGAFNWFKFAGDTYLIESHHDGRGANAGFMDGTDFIVKLSGGMDMSSGAINLMNGNHAGMITLVF